jgi:hypothetical protein
MNTQTAVDVVSVLPIEFSIAVKADSAWSAAKWSTDLKTKHPCIAEAQSVGGFFLDNGAGFISDIRITMEEDADYEQICALRAELKT